MDEPDTPIKEVGLPELVVLEHINGITNGEQLRAELDAQYCLKSIIEVKTKINELVDAANKRQLYFKHILGRLAKLEATTNGEPAKTHMPPPNSHTG